MTLPHRYIPNQVVKISRGTLNQMPLIIPDEKGDLCEAINFILRDLPSFAKFKYWPFMLSPLGMRQVSLTLICADPNSFRW